MILTITFSSFLLILLTYFSSTLSCYIWGTDSGVCSTETLDPIWRMDHMPFCGEVVKYPACLPKYQSLPPTTSHQYGRWTNHTILKKDQWVMENYFNFVESRIEIETNRTLKRQGKNEYGDSGRVIKRFHKNKDCQNSYKNYFCFINFPRCDVERDLTLPTCRSVCENYMKSCKYERGLWRCGKSKFFNGYEPEKPIYSQLNSKNVTYLRDYFPGQPFRENKYSKGGSELPICTPALKGSSSRRTGMNLLLSSVLIFCSIFFLI